MTNYELQLQPDGQLNNTHWSMVIRSTPNQIDIGWTPLHDTAENGNKDVVQLLIDRGANPNKANEEGRTPLHDTAYPADLAKVICSR